MKQVSREAEYPPVVGVPKVVGMTVVGIEPEIVTNVSNIEHIEVAILVSNVWGAICATAS